MAVPVNTFQTYQARGNREDLTDAIYNIAPEDTPFMSNVGRSNAKAVLHEWQIDTLADPDENNAYPEGDDAADEAITPTERVGNYVQISRKVARVSGTQEAVDKAGRRAELAYQMAKKSKELKRDMERMALANRGASPGSPSTPRRTAGLPAWLKTNTNFGTGGADPVYTSVPTSGRTDGTQRPFTEALLKDGIQQAWVEGAEPSMVSMGAFNKQAASTFSGIATKTSVQTGTKLAAIIGAADVYVSDFGTYTFVPNRFQRPRDVFGLDPDMASIMFLRDFQRSELAKTGDSDRRQILVEWGTKVNNEKAHFGIYDLTTSA